MNYLENLRGLIETRVHALLEPENNLVKQKLYRMEEMFIRMQKPNVFDPRDPDNVLSKQDDQFEEVANTMEDQNHFDPKNLTEFSFYHKILFLQKKFQPKSGND